MKKRFAWLVVAMLVLVGLGAMAVLLEWPASGLGRAIAERAERDLGLEITGGSYELSFLHGLVLENVEVFTTTEGRSYRAILPRARFVHNPRSLLSGVFEVREIRLESPVLELVEGDVLVQERSPTDTPSSSLLSFAVEAVRASDTSIRWSGGSSGEATTELQGVDIRLNELSLSSNQKLRGSILAVEGSGEFRAGESRFGDIEVSEARAELYLHEGNASLTLLNFVTPFAPFVAEMRVELQGSPFDYAVSTLGEPFDLGPILGAAPGAFGETSLLLEVFGRGPEAEGFRAQGSVTLPDGELPSIPLLAAVNEHLGREMFRVGEAYDETIAVIRVRDGYVLFQPFELSTGQGKATFRGRAYLNGELEMELVVQEGAAGTGTQVLRLLGTVEQPEIE